MNLPMTSLENHRGKHREFFKATNSIFMKLGNIESPPYLNWLEVFSKEAEFTRTLQESGQKAEMRKVGKHGGM